MPFSVFFMTNQVFVDFVKTGNKIKLFKIYGTPCENFTVLLNYQFEDLLLAKWFVSIIPYLENNPREGVVSVNGFNKWSFNYSIEIPLKYLRNLLYYCSLKMKMIMYKIVNPLLHQCDLKQRGNNLPLFQHMDCGHLQELKTGKVQKKSVNFHLKTFKIPLEFFFSIWRFICEFTILDQSQKKKK